MEPNEMRISVKWGIIGGKAWGNEKNPLVICIHGWVDNANSFDLLIPKLPNTFYYVCIDLPGHGKSSAMKSSLMLRSEDFVIVVKIVYDYLNQKKVILIGHSLGAFICHFFAQMYPNCVDKIISFDNIYSFLKPPHSYFVKIRNCFNTQVKYLESKFKSDSTYTKEEILQKCLTSRLTPMSRKSAEIILERNLKPVGNDKYQYVISQNVRNLIFVYWTDDAMADIIKYYPIKCPHLLIISTNSMHMQFAFKKVLQEFRKNPHFHYHIVKGNHEIHMDKADIVASIVTDFLLKYSNKL